MMKIINILLTSLLIIGVLPLKVDNSKKMNLYDIKINSLDGNPINLKAYKGQFL